MVWLQLHGCITALWDHTHWSFRWKPQLGRYLTASLYIWGFNINLQSPFSLAMAMFQTNFICIWHFQSFLQWNGHNCSDKYRPSFISAAFRELSFIQSQIKKPLKTKLVPAASWILFWSKFHCNDHLVGSETQLRRTGLGFDNKPWCSSDLLPCGGQNSVWKRNGKSWEFFPTGLIPSFPCMALVNCW